MSVPHSLKIVIFTFVLLKTVSFEKLFLNERNRSSILFSTQVRDLFKLYFVVLWDRTPNSVRVWLGYQNKCLHNGLNIRRVEVLEPHRILSYKPIITYPIRRIVQIFLRCV